MNSSLFLFRVIIAVIAIAFSGHNFAAKRAQESVKQTACQLDGSGHVSLLNTLPSDKCLVMVNGGAHPLHLGPDMSVVASHREAAGTGWDYYSASTKQYFRVLYYKHSSRGSNEKTAPGKVVLLKVKTGENPEQWQARNEFWAESKGGAVTNMSSPAKTVFAQNGGGETVNLANRTAPTGATTHPPVAAAEDCSKKSGFEFARCMASNPALGSLIKGATK